MPWSNQSGGGSGGGGPWGQRGGSGGGGPWGGGSGGGGGNGNPPDLEEILRRSQDRLKNLVPGGNIGGRGLLLGILALILIWLGSGIYFVRPNEVGLNVVVGRVAREPRRGPHSERAHTNRPA